MNQPDPSATGVSVSTNTANALHLPPGAKLHNGTFAIGQVLGQGGCGITYRGDDLNLRRAVAIKEFFPPGCTRSGNSVTISTSPTEYSAAREQFLEEARALARFTHRNIVNVLLVFEENNTAYMVMEFLKGKNLQQLVEDSGPLPEQQAIAHVAQMARALAVVHQEGFIHRDIKPANAFVCDDGRVVLIDFGLNKKLEVAQTYQTRQLSHAAPTGTEGCAPPEQYLRGSIQGIATDIYALGATLYFLVTGEVPVSAPERAMGAPFRAPANVNPSVSQSVSDAIMRALELKEAARPQSVQELLKTLTANPQTATPALRPSPAPNASPANQGSTSVAPPQPLTSPPDWLHSPPQSRRCPKCSELNYVTAKQCASCRTNLSQLSQQPPIYDQSSPYYYLIWIGLSVTMIVILWIWAFHT